MSEASDTAQGRPIGKGLDVSIRDRLLALFQQELARADQEALARGRSPQELSARLDARVARLRGQLDGWADPI